MSSGARNAANAIGKGHDSAAVALLTGVLEKLDEQGDDDWMHPGAEQAFYGGCIEERITVLM